MAKILDELKNNAKQKINASICLIAGFKVLFFPTTALSFIQQIVTE